MPGFRASPVRQQWQSGNAVPTDERLLRAGAAQETAKERGAAEEVKSASSERDRMLLEMRSREVASAQQRATQAQTAAQAAELQAEAARRQAAGQAAQAQSAEQRAALSDRQATEAAQQAAAASARAERLETSLKELSARETPRGTVVTLGDVLFDVGKSDLQSAAARDLDRLAVFLREFPDRRVQIEGYTDSTGSDSLNQALSEQRAGVVRNALVVRGVAPDRVVATGFGKESPVASNASASGRALNRRVEVVILEPPGRTLAR